jgi:amino acid permease
MTHGKNRLVAFSELASPACEMNFYARRNIMTKEANGGMTADEAQSPISKQDGKIGFWGVVAIGVGGMVGGGIFAVLGLAVQLAHGGTPVAFAVAGGVAMLTAYSYAKLSVAYPSRGGTVAFFDRAFGAGMITGSLNVLLWLSYVVMLSLCPYMHSRLAVTAQRSCRKRGRGAANTC